MFVLPFWALIALHLSFTEQSSGGVMDFHGYTNLSLLMCSIQWTGYLWANPLRLFKESSDYFNYAFVNVKNEFLTLLLICSSKLSTTRQDYFWTNCPSCYCLPSIQCQTSTWWFMFCLKPFFDVTSVLMSKVWHYTLNTTFARFPHVFIAMNSTRISY